MQGNTKKKLTWSERLQFPAYDTTNRLQGYQNKIQFISRLYDTSDVHSDYEVTAASIQVGIQTEASYFLIDNPEDGPEALTEYERWREFTSKTMALYKRFQLIKEIKLTEGVEFIQQTYITEENGNRSIKYRINLSHVASTILKRVIPQGRKRVEYIAIIVSVFNAFIPLGLYLMRHSRIVISFWTILYYTSSMLLSFLFTNVLLLFLFCAIRQAIKQYKIVVYLGDFIRLQNVDRKFVLGKKGVACSKVATSLVGGSCKVQEMRRKFVGKIDLQLSDMSFTNQHIHPSHPPATRPARSHSHTYTPLSSPTNTGAERNISIPINKNEIIDDRGIGDRDGLPHHDVESATDGGVSNISNISNSRARGARDHTLGGMKFVNLQGINICFLLLICRYIGSVIAIVLYFVASVHLSMICNTTLYRLFYQYCMDR